MIERTNKEIKRRSKVVGAFPNQEAVLRLSVSILIDINEEWITADIRRCTQIYNLFAYLPNIIR
jgi:transposase-like protein